jgi:biopolymer transport protein ExbD
MSRTFRARRNSVQEEGPTVNLTPLIDVVFVILVMFILIAPILEIDNISLADAPTKAKDVTVVEKDSSPIVIHVKPNDSILFNGRMTGIAVLQERLIEEKKIYPHAKPLVFHDRRAQFGTYQHVKNAVESAGFHEMDIVLAPAGK